YGFYAKATTLVLRFEKAADGKVERVVGLLGSQGLSGRPIREAKLAPEQMKAYAGNYYSEELRTLYTVSVRDGKVVVRHPRGESALTGWEKEEFTGPPGTPFAMLQFTRNGEKEVNGFLVSTGRSRNLRFARVEIRAIP